MNRRFFLAVGLGVAALVFGSAAMFSMTAAEATREVVLGSFTNFAAKFPGAFWHAGDAYSKSLKLGGQDIDLKSFTNDNKTVALQVKPAGKNGEWTGSFKLLDKNEPDDYWTFEFRFKEGRWRTGAGFKHTGKTKINLYEQQFGATSMRPFVDKEIEKIQPATK